MASLVERLQRSEHWPAEQLRDSQLEQLRALLVHAVTRSPLHRQRLGLTPQAAARIDWPAWRALPTLPRPVLQRQLDALRARTVPAAHGTLLSHSTTGSTGHPLSVVATQWCQFVYGALTLREHRWHRRDPSGRLLVVRAKGQEGDYPDWGVPVAELHATGPLRIVSLKHSVREQLRHIAQFDPHYLLTYASNAHALAVEAMAHGVRLPSLREVRVFAELPRPDLTAMVQRAFGATCQDVYSAEETGPIAAQCPQHGSYHVHAESVLVEILDEHGHACAPGQLGQVVVTALHNFATPLLRYELGDFAAIGGPCACGLTLPVLARIAGRSRNMLLFPDGSRRWPAFPGAIWLQFPAIRQVQLVQTAIDTVEVRMEADRDLDQAESDRLCCDLRERLGWPYALHLRRVECIRPPGVYKMEDFLNLVEPQA